MRWYLGVPMVLTLLLLAALPVMANSAIGAAADESMDLEEAIWAYEDAFVAGDVDQLMAFFTETASSYPPAMEPVVGKQAIEEFYTGMFGTYKLERTFEVLESTVSGEYATRLGEWTNTLTPLSGDGEAIVEVGHCMFGYKLVDGEWLVDWQIWNTFTPAEDPLLPPAMMHDGTPC